VIRREDVEHVRERSRIEEVVGEHVTLKAAGMGSMKGLCPFHDERTPSFHVRPQVGLWHCFGCGEGGDVISFVQKLDHLAFAEAVERLAARLGFQVRYEDEGAGTPSGRRERVGQRQRLLEANRIAARFYAEQLGAAGDAAVARQFLLDRGFDREVADHFGLGFAPRPGEVLLRHLRGRGFTEDELLASGLAGQGRRGLYDRFRGRLLWPIRDLTGDVVGFGARRIFDDDHIEAKYLNTPETQLYRKSQVLYGVDLAKREIARTHRLVVVEGYTDVMACHLAGVGTAVATCGTAFGADHIRIVRRLLGDDNAKVGEVVFTFDGDEAGQKAAMRAFEDDQRFVAQTFVAVAEDGMDPCELRQRRGDEAVRELVDRRQPMFEFAIRTRLRTVDLDTAEGRVRGLRATVPVVARIRDASLRPEYARQLAGWLGMEVEPVLRAVVREVRDRGRRDHHGSGAAGPGDQATGPGANRDGTGDAADQATGTAPAEPRIDPRDPVVRVEREALECLLQLPHLVPAEDADGLSTQAFQVPAFRAVHHAVQAAGGIAAASRLPTQAWADAVRENAPQTVSSLVTQLAVAPLPADTEEALGRYVTSVVLRIVEMELGRKIATLRSRMQRTPPDDPGLLDLLGELTRAETRRRELRDRMTGSS
jgi:DNA primase